MVQSLSIIFFLGFLQFLLGSSKVPVFCVTLYLRSFFSGRKNYNNKRSPTDCTENCLTLRGLKVIHAIYIRNLSPTLDTCGQQYGQCKYNVTLRRFRVRIVVVKSLKYNMFWVCVCSLCYQA